MGADVRILVIEDETIVAADLKDKLTLSGLPCHRDSQDGRRSGEDRLGPSDRHWC